MKTKVVTFAKPHFYSGQYYKVGDKLDLPEARAKMLEAAGVLDSKGNKKGSE